MEEGSGVRDRPMGLRTQGLPLQGVEKDDVMRRV